MEMYSIAKLELLEKLGQRRYCRLSTTEDIENVSDLLHEKDIRGSERYPTSYRVDYLARNPKGIELTATEAGDKEPRTIALESIWLAQNENRVSVLFKIDNIEYRYTVDEWEA